MRLHVRDEPRLAALLLLPVLLAAGAVPAAGGGTASAAPAGLDTGHLPLEAPEFAEGALQPGRVERPVVVARRAARSARATDAQPVESIEDRGRAALASLDYDWRALGYSVVFRPYDGHGLGSANRATRLITVYVRRGQSALSLRVSLAHELGHALDFEHGTQERRNAYSRIRGLDPSRAWFPCNRCNDYASPAGDFAEVFAAWLVGPGDFRSRLAGPPTAQQLRELGPLFALPRPARAVASPAAEPTPAPTPAPEQPEERSGGIVGLLGGEPSPDPRR